MLSLCPGTSSKWELHSIAKRLDLTPFVDRIFESSPTAVRFAVPSLQNEMPLDMLTFDSVVENKRD